MDACQETDKVDRLASPLVRALDSFLEECEFKSPAKLTPWKTGLLVRLVTVYIKEDSFWLPAPYPF